LFIDENFPEDFLLRDLRGQRNTRPEARRRGSRAGWSEGETSPRKRELPGLEPILIQSLIPREDEFS